MHVHINFRRFSFFLTLSVLASIALTSCPPPTPEEESLKVILATGAPDAGKTIPKGLVPVDEATILSLEARIQAIRILSLDGTETVSTGVLSSAKTVDLLDLTDVAALLSETTVPAGPYTGVELVISEASMVLADNPLETIALALAEGGTYTLDFEFEIAPESAGLLYLELGGLNVLEGEGGNFTLSPDFSAALRETVADTRIEGSIESADSAAETFVLAAGTARYTVDYSDADIFVPGDYSDPSGTPAILAVDTDVAVVGTAGLDGSVAPHTIVVLDLPGTPEDDGGDLVTVCLLFGEGTPTAQTLQISRNRLDQVIGLGGFEGPCEGGDPFTLTYAAGPGGTVEGTTPQSVAPGADGSAVTAVPLDGYAFVNWSDGSTLNPRRDRSVGADITVTANFAELFALTYTAGVGGTIAGNASQLVPEGGSGSPVTAVRNDSFVFDGWSDGRSDNPRTDINIAADLAVTANFLEVFQLTYTASAGGTLEGVTLQSVIDGNDGTAVTAIPGEGFIFLGWSDGSEDNPRTDLNVDGDVTVRANFLAQYTLTYVAGANGSLTGATSQIVNDGGDGTSVTAVPNATFGFAGWSDGRSDNPRTDVDVDGDVSVSANFAPAILLTYVAGPNGTLTGNTSQVIGRGGTSSPVTATGNEGFGFDHWSDNRTANPRVDANVTTDKTVTAIFVEAFTLTYTSGLNGALAGTTTQTVNSGRSGTAVTAVADPGYVFLRWSDAITQNPRTDLLVTADVSVTAEFAKLFALRYAAGANGTVTGPLTQSVREGTDGRAVTAVPSEGFGFANWSDGRFENPRIDNDVTADISVTANFAREVALNYHAGANGIVSGTATQEVPVGEDGTEVTAVANDGYFFVEWSDGTSENPRVEEDVEAGISVTANFFRKPEMLNVSASKFTMGRRDDGDDALYNAAMELPRHDVTLPAYEIGKYEVTNEEYVVFLNYLGRAERGLLLRADGRQWSGTNGPIYYNGGGGQLTRIFLFNYGEVMVGFNRATNLVEPLVKPGLPEGTNYSVFDHPVTESTWYGTALYCNWLSERMGLEPVYDTETWVPNFDRNGYRMPTEAEWECAAAWDGEKHWIYGFQSDTLTGRDRANYHIGNFVPPPDFDNPLFVNPMGLLQDTQTSYTSPVGWFNGINVSPNQNVQTQNSVSPVGAYDMSGNLFEWCHDWFSPTYYEVSPSVDPRGPETGVKRVIRGGGWARQVTALRNRTAFRWEFDPADGDGLVGIRLARSDSRLVQFNLSYSAGSNGSLDGASAQVVESGNSGTAVTAVPAMGYAFAGWSDGRMDNPRTDTDVASNVSVTASFAIPVNLTYAAGLNGKVEGGLQQTLGIGGTGMPVLAIADEGYVFVQWSDGVTSNPRQDHSVVGDISVTAVFLELFTFNYTAGADGAITGNTTQFVTEGGNGTPVTAVGNEGFVFEKWSDEHTDNPRADLNASADISVTANFIELFQLTYVAGSGGSVEGDSPQYVIEGGDGTPVTAVAMEGYIFSGWSDNRLDNPRTDIDVTAELAVTANFLAQHTLTYLADTNGSLTGITSQLVIDGGEGAPVTAVPNEGYFFLQWSDGRVDNPRTDTDVAATESVTATFFEDVIMLPVPGGTFTMGSSETGDDALFDRTDELPRREVVLDPYEIGKYEVNNSQFAAFMNYLHHPSRDLLKRPNGATWQGFPENVWFYDCASPRVVFAYALSEDGLEYEPESSSFVTKHLEGIPAGTFYDKASHPVTEPTWYGAVLFANWLSERTGLEPVYDLDTWEADLTKNGYRLPTEAEWERAAAWDGEKHWIYPIMSDTLTTRDRANFHVDPFIPNPDFDNTSFINPLGILQNSKESYTSPIGWFNGINISPNGNIQTVDSPSPVGAYDMAGNVVEWCQDWYSETYYGENVTDNPTGPTIGTGKVARGGAWARLVKKDNQRSSRRFRFDPNHSDGINGFRLAR